MGTVSVGEARLRALVASVAKGYAVEYNVRPEWLLSRKGRPLELDIWFPELQLAIEYQGWQHWTAGKADEVSPQSVKVQRARDLQKAHLCHNAGVHLYGVTWPEIEGPSGYERTYQRIQGWMTRALSGRPPGLMRVPPVITLIREGNRPFNPHKVRYVTDPDRPRWTPVHLRPDKKRPTGKLAKIARVNASLDRNALVVKAGFYKPQSANASPMTADTHAAAAEPPTGPTVGGVRRSPFR